jgi:hypothetical protein
VDELKLARSTIPRFRMNWAENELNLVQKEKGFIFSEYIFSLQINLEKSR